MRIWQIHALSSILKVPIYSAYPDLCNRNVRNDLHRVVRPILETKSEPVFILWTSNRDDTTVEHWVPNHFVTLLKLPNIELGTTEQIGHSNPCDQNTQSQDNVTIYVYNTTNTENDNPEEINNSEFVLEKIDGTEFEYVLQKAGDSNECTENESSQEDERACKSGSKRDEVISNTGDQSACSVEMNISKIVTNATLSQLIEYTWVVRQ